MKAQSQTFSSTKPFCWKLFSPILSTKRKNNSIKGTDDIDMVPSATLNLSGKSRMSMKPTEKRGMQEKNNMVRVGLDIKRDTNIKELEDDIESMPNDSKDSEIERIFEGLCDYED